jgi:hypothetical protein
MTIHGTREAVFIFRAAMLISETQENEITRQEVKMGGT